MTIPIRGTAALAVAAAIVAATAVWLPAYRWFLLISIGIGVAVAGGLYLWHRFRYHCFYDPRGPGETRLLQPLAGGLRCSTGRRSEFNLN